VSSNPAHGEIYLIQLYEINLSVTSDRSVVSSTNTTDRHDINEIQLKVSLNTITLTLNWVVVLAKLKTKN